MDAKQKCLFINDEIPKAKLFESEKREVHPDCNTSWRISPEPFWITDSDLRWFEELGTHLLKFYRACNLLYSQSVRGIQPGWVAEYLELGKPEPVIQYGRMNRFKSQLPGVLRPDILPTADGMAITELDAIPGFIGGTGCFTYSAVEGARANALEHHVPEEVKLERQQRFMEKQAEISARRLQAKVGTRQTVIVDEVTPEGAVARTKGDAPEIDGNVFIDGAIHLEPGMLVDVEIEEADAYDLWGHLVH